MKNIIRNICLLSTIIIFTISMLSGCNINKNNIEKPNNQVKSIESEIKKENTMALEIDNPKIEIVKKDGNQYIDTQTKIKNISNFTIRDINLVYKEYNDSDKAVSTIDSFLELTLNPGEVSIAHASHEKYINRAEVIKYSYKVDDKWIYVDLESNNIDVVNTNETISKNKKYDILAISNPEKINNVKGGYNSKLIVKNISENDIGSLSIIIGELNEKNEYIGVTYLNSYEVIKTSQEIELNSVHSNSVKKIEVLGYIYDDVMKSSTIDVNYKLSQSTIIKN